MPKQLREIYGDYVMPETEVRAILDENKVMRAYPDMSFLFSLYAPQFGRARVS